MILTGIQPLTPEWFVARQGAITATDIPKILNLSDWGTGLDVFLRVTGKLEDEPENEEQKPWLEWGRRTEEMHRAWVAEDADLYICESPGLVQHPELDYLLCTPDGFFGDAKGIFEAFDENGGRVPPENWEGVFETKAPSPWTGFDPEVGAPLPYQIQVQAQMAICGLDEGILSSLHWPGPKWARVEKHEQFQEAAIATVVDFWENHIQKDIPPDVTHKDVKTLEKLFPVADGSVATLSASLEYDSARWQEITEELSALKKREKDLDAERGTHRARITAEMGSATWGVLGETIFKAAYQDRKVKASESRFRGFRTVKEIK